MLIGLGLSLINYRPSYRQLLLISIVYSPFVYVFRRLDVPYGFHTILLAIAIICITYLILKISLTNSFIATIAGLIIVLTVETTYVPLIAYFSNIDILEILDNPFYNILFSLPQSLTLLSFFIYLRKKRLYLLDLSKGV